MKNLINIKSTHQSSINKSTYSIKELRSILKSMANSWERRSQVKVMRSPIQFHDESPDFIESLLPFKDHPLYINSSDSMKSKILSCGWIIYNEKTVAIETSLINPICTKIVNGEIPHAKDDTSKTIASEVMVDESYHTLLSIEAIALTKMRRNIKINLPQFNLVNNLHHMQNIYSTQTERDIILLAVSTVSEIFISDYLKLLSDDQTIQPINRITVNTHRIDELSHANVFKRVIFCIFKSLSLEQQNLFVSVLYEAVGWFADNEFNVWGSVLRQIGFKNYNTMIFECQNFHNDNSLNLDYSGIYKLMDELGITVPNPFFNFNSMQFN